MYSRIALERGSLVARCGGKSIKRPVEGFITWPDNLARFPVNSTFNSGRATRPAPTRWTAWNSGLRFNRPPEMEGPAPMGPKEGGGGSRGGPLVACVCGRVNGEARRGGRVLRFVPAMRSARGPRLREYGGGPPRWRSRFPQHR